MTQINEINRNLQIQVITDDNIDPSSVSGGNSSLNGIVPDPDDVNSNSTSTSVQMILAGLAGLSSRTIEVTDADIEALMSELEELLGESEEITITIHQERERTMLDQKMEKLDEAILKLKKAMRREGNKAYDILKASFSLAAALASIAIGAALSTTSGHVGAMMIAAGSVQLVLAVDGMVEATTGESMFYMMAKAAGASDKEASETAMAIKLALAGVLVIIAIASLGMAIYAAHAATTATASATTVATSTSTTSATLSAAQSLSQTMTLATSLGFAIGDSLVAYKSVRASAMRLDESELRGDALEIEAELQVLRDLVDGAIRSLSDAKEAAVKMISTYTSMKDQEVQMLKNVTFSV